MKKRYEETDLNKLIVLLSKKTLELCITDILNSNYINEVDTNEAIYKEKLLELLQKKHREKNKHKM
jgi:hypothetical protein